MDCLRCNTNLTIINEEDIEGEGPSIGEASGLLVSLYCTGCRAYAEFYLPHVKEFRERHDVTQPPPDGE